MFSFPFLPHRVALAAVSIVAIAGCAESRRTGAPDDPDRTAPIEVMVPPDAGQPEMDAGPPPMTLPEDGQVGASCDNNGACDSGACFRGFPFPWAGGYCSTRCDSEDDCGGGSTCEPIFTGFAMCLDSCDPDADERTCRQGYGCSPRPTGMFSCLPGCTDESDCAGDAVCEPGAGFLRAGVCFTEGAATGDACERTSDCGLGAQCFNEAASSWPGGVCARGPCNPTSGAGCGAGEACIPTGGGGGGVCVASCGEDADCREGYACDDGSCQPACDSNDQCSAPRVCNPPTGRCAECATDDDCSGDDVCAEATGECTAPFDPRDYGRFCDGDDTVCQDGRCLLDSEGYPSSYCVFEGCSELEPCPGAGVCVPGIGEGPGLCHLGCDSDDRCRTGYTCQPADPDVMDGPSACLPSLDA